METRKMTAEELEEIQRGIDEGWTNFHRSKVIRLMEERAPLTAEVERLRGLVRSAYEEGWSDGSYEQLLDWEASNAKAALEEKQ